MAGGDGHDQVFVLGVAVASLPVAGDGQGGLAGQVAPGDGVGAGGLPHAVELHHLVVFKLEGVDQEHHLGRIGVDQHDVGLKGFVDQGRHGHGLIFAQGNPGDGGLILFAVLLGLHPDDAAEGPVLEKVRGIGQADDGGAHGRQEIVHIGAHGPVEVPDEGDHLAEGTLVSRRRRKGIRSRSSFFSSILKATGKDLSLINSSIRRISFSQSRWAASFRLSPLSCSPFGKHVFGFSSPLSS